MAKKRKSTRMFSRAERAANREARERELAAIPPAERQQRADEALIRSATQIEATDVFQIAEAWLGFEDDEPEFREVDLIDALARQYERATGRKLSRDEAEIVIEAFEDRRDAEQEAAAFARGEEI